MSAIPAIAAIILMVLSPLVVAIAPKPWHRAVFMIVLGMGLLAVMHAVSGAQRKILRAQVLQETLRSQQELWTSLERTLSAGQYDEALNLVRSVNTRIPRHKTEAHDGDPGHRRLEYERQDTPATDTNGEAHAASEAGRS